MGLMNPGMVVRVFQLSVSNGSLVSIARIQQLASRTGLKTKRIIQEDVLKVLCKW